MSVFVWLSSTYLFTMQELPNFSFLIGPINFNFTKLISKLNQVDSFFIRE
jgi:hypothetical protein